MYLKMSAVSVLALALVACGGGDQDTTVSTETAAKPIDKDAAIEPIMAEESGPEIEEGIEEGVDVDFEEMVATSLVDILAQVERRGEEAAARDQFRHPAETLAFLGLEPTMTLVEVSPGGGWYTDILAPYVGQGGGKYIGANTNPARSERAAEIVSNFTTKYASGEFGDVDVTIFGRGDFKIADDGSADMVVTFRNVHNWVGNGFDEEAFGKFYAALKPGGVLGVVEHRLPEDREEDAANGYVKESYVISLAEAAGFVLDGRSEVNANPADTADHPFGVWTLPPVSRTSDRDGNTPEGFDPETYLAIGESDRMTLRFVKPAE